MSEARLPVTLFADFTCPFCYVTETALDRLAETRALELRPRAFELYPPATPLPEPPHPPHELEAAAPLARELDLPLLDPPQLRPRTRKAHEAASFAATRGLSAPMRRALYRAYWTERLDIGRIDVLMELAAGVGIDPIDLKIALDIDRQREDVLRDLALARRLRVAGVPTGFVGSGGGARILHGAQSLAALDEAVKRG